MSITPTANPPLVITLYDERFDRTGKFVVPPQYTYVDNYDCDIAYVKLEGIRGYINKKGEWVWREK